MPEQLRVSYHEVTPLSQDAKLRLEATFDLLFEKTLQNFSVKTEILEDTGGELNS
jgi:hypothetical protein